MSELGMTGQSEAHLPGLADLVRMLDDEPHRPRLVVYTAGGRTELSGASLANWTAKVAGLLNDELGLGPGDVAAVRATAGWQLAPVLLGCWWAGLTVTAENAPAQVAFVDPGADADAADVFVLSHHPFGAPAEHIASHQTDFTTAVRAQSDRAGAAADGDGAAVQSSAGAMVRSDLARSAAAVARRIANAGAPPERPVLCSTVEWGLPEGVARTLLAALVADGCLVQCAPDTPEEELRRAAAAERVTVTVGRRLPGLPHLPA